MPDKEKTVIIADDDKTVRDPLKKFFEGIREFRVIEECADGETAVELCLKHHPDIVLMDIDMPVKDGITATSQIISERAAGCVLMLTSFDDPDYISKAIDAGASGYLVKPVLYGSLLPTLKLGLEHSKEMHVLNKSVTSLRKRSEQRTVINEAKLFLMETHGISEEEAFTMIREYSRKKQLSMEQISEMILKKK